VRSVAKLMQIESTRGQKPEKLEGNGQKKKTGEKLVNQL
jgi:hypothetical protein